MESALFPRIIRFFKTESSWDALRNILTILIPGLFLFFFWDGPIAIAFAVGTLLAALTDVPGNQADKRLTALYGIPLFFLTGLSISLALYYESWTIVLLLGIFGFLYTIIALLGFRINIVGNLALIVASFTIGLRPADPFVFTFALTAGAACFYAVSLIQAYLFPHRSLSFAVEGGIQQMAKLIRLKIDCYNEAVPLHQIYRQLSALHIKVSDQLEAVRSILLRDKRLLEDQHPASKIWLAKLYQLVDLYELLMAIDNDYEHIRDTLKGGKTLILIRESLAILSKATARLRVKGRSRGFHTAKRERLEGLLQELETTALTENLQKKELTISIVNQLRQVANILQNIHIPHALEDNTWVANKDISNFAAPQHNWKTIAKNLSFKSAIFSYAVRMALLLMLGGLIGFLLPEYRYASWILLTIILVARPSYNITQKRNYQRIIGSLIGIAISLILLVCIQNICWLAAIAALCLYLFLLFNKPDYLVCVIFITITILLGQKIHEGSIQDLLGSRFAFTLLGSIFAVLGCLAIPINHYRSVAQNTDSLIQHFKSYLEKIKESYASANINYYDLRLLRKFTQASLAQSYDSLEQLEKEPIRGRYYKTDIIHFQTLAYRINALLVGLSIQMTKLGQSLPVEEMSERANYVAELIQEAELLSKKGYGLARSKRAAGWKIGKAEKLSS